MPTARTLTKLARFATLAVAAALALWWILGPWLGNVAMASKDGRWGLWVRSGSVMFAHSNDPAFYVERNNNSRYQPCLQFSFAVMQYPSRPPHVAASWLPSKTDRTWLPFRGTYFGTGVISVTLPLWLCAVPFATASYLLKRWHRRQVRLAQGTTPKCPTCGYDQAGLSAGAKCPECGN